MRVPFRSLFVGVLAAWVVVSPAAGAALIVKPSLVQLKTDVTAGVKLSKPPNLANTVPPLTVLISSNPNYPRISSSCYPNSGGNIDPHPLKNCSFGDLASRRILYLFGDSEAEMWLPALDPIGKELHYRIVFTGRHSCPPWPGQGSTGFDGISDTDCNSLVKQELAQIGVLKPAVVMPVGDGFHDGTGVRASIAVLAAAEQKLVKTAGRARTVFLSPMPMYSTPSLPYGPNECLISGGDIRSCEFSPTTLINGRQASALRIASKATKAPLVIVTPLFCTSSKCSLVVANHLVYFDSSHANRYYVSWIASALEKLLKHAL